MSELLGDRYQLQEVLARGGMAAVWRAHDVRLGRAVAVKVLDGAGLTEPTAMERFRREARTVAALAHHNIVAGYDFGTHNGAPYFVMELVEGESLAAMTSRGPLDARQAVDIAAQTCDALAAAHAIGVVHRDIKPANIMVTPGGTVKVCDFGIARLQHGEATRASLTNPRTAIGTTEYMAPEQASGERVDARTDLYALGCVLYAMFTGAPPFTGDSPIEVVHQHLHRPPAPLAARRPDLPAGLDALVGSLLAKNPADRPAGADEVRARLRALSDQLAAPGTGPAAVPPAGSGPDPGPAPTVGTAAAPTARTPRHAVRATAPVVSPTRTMPAVRLDEEYDYAPVPAVQRGPRIGLVGIAVVAIAAAVLAGAVVAVLMTGRSQPSTGAAVTPSSTATLPAPRATGGPAELVGAVQAAIDEQTRAGQLNAASARELNRKLSEIGRQISKGELDKAAEKVAELRDRLAELRKDERITNAGYDAVVSSLDLLAGSLPAAADNDDD